MKNHSLNKISDINRIQSASAPMNVNFEILLINKRGGPENWKNLCKKMANHELIKLTYFAGVFLPKSFKIERKLGNLSNASNIVIINY